MVEIVWIVVGMGVCIVDINMGCLVKKVMGGLFGVVLMCDLDYVLLLIDVVVVVVFNLLVMLKMWLGWDEDCLNVVELVVCVIDVGVWMLIVYGCMWV